MRAVIALCAVAAAFTACQPIHCDYQERCSGNTLEICRVDVGLAGQHFSTIDCSQNGGTCVTQSNQHAVCQAPQGATCDATFVPYCQGSVLVQCDLSTTPGQVVTTDCSTAYSNGLGQCIDNGGGNAACYD